MLTSSGLAEWPAQIGLGCATEMLALIVPLLFGGLFDGGGAQDDRASDLNGTEAFDPGFGATV